MDAFVFSTEETVLNEAVKNEKRQLLIVDDEEEVHAGTKLALRDVIYQGKEKKLGNCQEFG